MIGVSASDIRFVFYLPNIASYLDRVELIGHIADKVGRGVLVTSRIDFPLETLRLGKLEVLEIPRGRRYPGRTAITASRVIDQLMATGEFNVVHDTFAHLSPLFLRRIRHRGVVFITSFYSIAEWDFRKRIRPAYGMLSVTHPNLRQYIKRSIMQRIVALLADCVVVQAPELIDRVKEYNKRAGNKLAWIPNNVVVSKKHSRMSKTVDDSTIHLLWAAGGFDRTKGADELLTLLRRAMERGISIHVSAVGASSPFDSSLRPYFDDQYLGQRMQNEKLEGHISFLNRISPELMGEYYRDADWLFHMSHLDGSPRVALEALARGLPVIGFRHPGLNVLDPQDSFILFSDPFDPDAVLDRMVSDKNNLLDYQRRSTAGSRYANDNFSSDRVAERYVDLYMRLLSEQVD
ncbi:MAG: glycosyltransferase family 4 protein [Dehalococcoidia bacterium]